MPTKLMRNYENNISYLDKMRVYTSKLIKLGSIKRQISMVKYISNFWDYYLIRLGFLKSCVINFRDNENIEFSNDKLLDLFDLRFITILRKEGFSVSKIKNKFLVRSDNIKFIANNISELSVILENFIENQYDWLDAKDKKVVDIGANIGDTAVYFSKVKKAKKVIAFEPYPYSYNIAKKNIILNKLKNVVILNQGVGNKETFIRIKEGFISTGGSNLKSFDSGKKVKIVTLKDIVKKYKIENDILKMDCEGCEYSIILNADKETLRSFDQIMIECHYGYKNIERKLKETGFEVSHSKVHYSYNKSAENPVMYINLVKAKLI